MIRTGTLVSRTLGCCAVLSALGLVANRVEAQSSASRSQTSGGEWAVSGESDAAVDAPNDAAWRPNRADAQNPTENGDTPTRWIAPTRKSGGAVTKQQTASTPIQPAPATKQQISSNRTTVREPNPFTPPAEAQQLSAPNPQLARPTPATQKSVKIASQAHEAAPTDKTAVKAPAQAGDANKSPHKVVSAAQPSASQSAAQASPARKNQNVIPANITPASDEVHNNTRAVAGRPRPHVANQSRVFDDGNWVRPLKQVAFQANEEEMLPSGEGPSMRSMSGPEDMPGMPGPGGIQSPGMGGEWIDGSPSGPCCNGQCEVGGCDSGCCEPCGDGCCESCGQSGSNDLCYIGVGDDESCHTIRVRVPRFQEVVIFGGVHGFKNPYDRNRDSGNFGFQEGFNVGAKIPFLDFGYQFGYQAAQSQLNGDSNTGDTSGFTQHFITAGVFRRVPDGLQGGIVWDLLKDGRDNTIEFTQVRGEVSFVDCGCHEFGADVAIHMKDHSFVNVDDEEEITTINRFRATDQYLLFYRMHGCRGGEGRVFGGLSDDSDVIIGSDFLLPMMASWSLQSEFTYLIPDNSGGSLGAKQEAWNIAINLVWHWHGHARSCHSNPYRPLFNVADNGSLILDDRP